MNAEQQGTAGEGQPEVHRPRCGRVLLLLVVIPAAAVLGALGGGFARVGSFQDTLRYLNGERVFVRPHELDFGEGREGDVREGPVSVRNVTGKDLHVIGCRSSCDCISPGRFPVRIAQGETAELPIRVGYRRGETAFSYELYFFTDSSHLPQFRVTVRGRTKPTLSDQGE
ncbi:MAG: hypothetical protein ACRC33_16840 [Gemmataceae bacterium]